MLPPSLNERGEVVRVEHPVLALQAAAGDDEGQGAVGNQGPEGAGADPKALGGLSRRQQVLTHCLFLSPCS